MRMKTGVQKFPDGWNVVVELDGKRTVYDPTFATEKEAEAKANELAEALRRRAQREGMFVVEAGK